MIKEGDKLRERWTDLVCTVESIACDHMVVRFDGSGLRAMVRHDRYRMFNKLEKSNV